MARTIWTIHHSSSELTQVKAVSIYSYSSHGWQERDAFVANLGSAQKLRDKRFEMPFKIPEAVRTRAEMTQETDTIVIPKGSVGRIRTQRQFTTRTTARPKRNSRKKIDYSWNDRGQTPKSQCRGHAVLAEREKTEIYPQFF